MPRDQTAPPAPLTPPQSGGLYGWVVVATLCVVYSFNYLDRQFLSVLAEPVKRELHLSDAQLGLLTGPAFALFYTAFGIPVASLADRGHRTRIIAGACALWSLFTACCGLAGSFATLALFRIGVGVGEAGGSPPAYSIISDYFPPASRGRALAVYSLGVPIGSMFGAASGGLIAAHYGWRAAFLALGAMGLILAPIILAVVREPRRGRLDGAAPLLARPSFVAAIGAFLGRPKLLFTALAAGLTAFVGYAAQIWGPAFLMREKGMTLEQVALWYSLAIGISGVTGTWLSGFLVDRLGARRPSAYALAPGIAILICLPFFLGYVFAPGWPAALAFVMAISLLQIMYLPAALAVVQNSVPASQRVTSGAFLLFVLNLIGLGGGPPFVGFLSDHFRPRLGVHALQAALVWLGPIFILAFVCQLAAAYFMEREARAGVS
jgi:predicted MFS family arabinose efflux permease